MLTTELLTRSLGLVSPLSTAQTQTRRQVLALQPAPRIWFDGGESSFQTKDDAAKPAHQDGAVPAAIDGESNAALAHKSGVNSLVIDRFEGRYLITGGANGNISMWDLEGAEEEHGPQVPGGAAIHRPLGSVPKSATSHKNGITALSFFPFDSLAFTSSSYDHTIKVYDSSTLAHSATFDLSSVVYSHAISPIASHMLVACATQHPSVRLVDLRTSASTHSLAGHGAGAIMSVAWSPVEEYILASGGVDGTVRFWDVRRSVGMLGQLDMEDSVGVVGYNQLGLGARRRERGKAHANAVNGILWINRGRHVVTTGHDERIRVWDMHTGANTLANFGPMVRNRHLSTLLPVATPSGLLASGDNILFYPNEGEILMYETFEGKLLKRLKAPSTVAVSQGAGVRNPKNRVTALAWRMHSGELVSAHGDGTVRSWRPRTTIDAFVDEQDLAEEEDGDTEAGARKRKRQVLEDIYRDLTAPKVTFS